MSEHTPQANSDDNTPNIGQIGDAIRRACNNLPDGELHGIEEDIGNVAADLDIAAAQSNSPLLGQALEGMRVAKNSTRKARELIARGRTELGSYLIGIGLEGELQRSNYSPLDNPNAKLRPPSAEEIATKCKEDVEGRLEAVLQQFQEGKKPDTALLQHLGPLVAGAIRWAILAGDIGKAESYLPIMRYCDEKALFAHACFAIGTPAAFKVLGDNLKIEQDERALEYMGAGEEEQKGLFAVIRSLIPSLLDSTVISCREKGISAEYWIQKYAINNEDIWRRRWGYYVPVSKLLPLFKGEPVGIDELIFNYLSDETLDNSTINRQLGSVIPFVEDPELQRILLNKYIATTPNIAQDEKQFKKHVQLASRLIMQGNAKDICTTSVVNSLDNTINNQYEDLLVSGSNPADIAKWHIEWCATKKLFYDKAKPAEIVRSVNKMTGKVLAECAAAGSGFQAEEAESLLLYSTSLLLESFALRAVRSGNIEDASVYITDIPIPIAKRKALEECTEHITSPDDLEKLIKIDGFTSTFAKDFTLQIAVAKALLQKNTTAVATAVEALLPQSLTHNGDITDSLYIERGLQYILDTDKAQAIAVGRRLLSKIPDKQDFLYEKITGILIKAGDPNIPDQVYKHIRDNQGSTEVTRLYGLLQLAERLGPS